MSLLYKPDWEETKETYVKWWNGEYIGRCAISVKAPISKSPARKPPLLPNTIEDRWLDFSYIESKNEYIMQNTYYGAEAFPLFRVPDIQAVIHTVHILEQKSTLQKKPDG